MSSTGDRRFARMASESSFSVQRRGWSMFSWSYAGLVDLLVSGRPPLGHSASLRGSRGGCASQERVEHARHRFARANGAVHVAGPARRAFRARKVDTPMRFAKRGAGRGQRSRWQVGETTARPWIARPVVLVATIKPTG
jgi:hypothetical protein